MAKHSLGNKRLGLMLFLSTVCICLNINLGKESNQEAMAYEANELVFIIDLNNFVSMSQEQADAVCKANFRDLREQGIFDEKVEKNTWHIWAHLKNRQCVMNIYNQPSSIQDSVWTPSNNRNKGFWIRIPRFN